MNIFFKYWYLCYDSSLRISGTNLILWCRRVLSWFSIMNYIIHCRHRKHSNPCHDMIVYFSTFKLSFSFTKGPGPLPYEDYWSGLLQWGIKVAETLLFFCSSQLGNELSFVMKIKYGISRTFDSVMIFFVKLWFFCLSNEWSVSILYPDIVVRFLFVRFCLD